MTTELARMPVSEIATMADAAVKSGLFPALKTREAAMTLMLLCQAEGLHPITALRRYHIIQGTPALRTDAILGDFQARGGKVKWVETTVTKCAGEFTSPGTVGATLVEWTMEDAARAGLAGKENWKKYPRQMLRARVIAEGVRLAMPEVVAGVYSQEEVQDFVPPLALSVASGAIDVKAQLTSKPPELTVVAAPARKLATVDEEGNPFDFGEEPPHDPETGEVVEEPEPMPPRAAEGATQAQLQAIYIGLKAAGFSTKSHAQDRIEEIIGHPLGKGESGHRTITGLTRAEASKVLDLYPPQAKAARR